MSRIDRRTALGALAGAALAPWVWVKRAGASAGFPAFGAARHVLILYAGGGLRGAPLFWADVSTQHNPYGSARIVDPRAAWQPGALLEGEPALLDGFGAGARLLPVPQIAGDIAVLAGVDLDPGAQRPLVDHASADARLTTVSRPDGDLGWLSIVRRERPDTVLPPVDLGRSSFARATGAYAAHRPMSLASAADLSGRSTFSAGAERARRLDGLRAARDDAFLASRPPHARAALERLLEVRAASRVYAGALRSPALDLLGAPDAELGGATNSALLAALSAQNEDGFGLDVALALRLFQLGVPAVSVLRDRFDTHSDEDETFPGAAADLARQISGLSFLLRRLRDKEGTVLWDRTVVVVVSEMARDHTDPATGYNSARGSDHQGSPASRNQVWPLFGGPITGRRLGALDPVTLAPAGGPAIPAGAVMATLLALLGVDPAPYYAEAPLGGGLFG